MTEIAVSNDRFNAALAADGAGGDIGTLREKTVHRTLKYYFCPDPSHHEIQLLGKICDAMVENTVYEIQTGSFTHLKDKLSVLLPEYPVNVVYPMIVNRFVTWVDPATGETLSRRLSGKHGSFTELLPQLYAIKEYLDHENLTLTVARIECEDVRLLDGYGAGKKIRASKYDKIPTGLLGLTELKGLRDVSNACPYFEGEFKAGQIYRLLRLKEGANAWRTLKMLEFAGRLRRSGSDGKAALYTFLK